jgi:hypothetical protein
MKYQNRIVCFLDILGFKGHIKNTLTSSGEDDLPNIENIISAINNIRYFTDIDKREENENKEVTQFSDSIVISFLATEESGVFYSLLEIMWIQINLVLHGILCRGAIVRGKLIHTEKYLFGPAMVDAYTLESKAAMYPRVILDESIIKAGIEYHGRHHLPHHEKDSIMSLLRRDTDGMYYIDYITRAQSELNDPELDYPNYLFQLGSIISSGLNSTDPSVAIKFRWLKEKYSPHLSEIKEHKSKDLDSDVQEAYQNIPDL